MKPFLFLAAVSSVAIAGAANASCKLTDVTVTGGHATVIYDPFDSTPSPQSIHVKLTGSDCVGARVSVAATADPSSPLTVSNALNLGTGPYPLKVDINDAGGAPDVYPTPADAVAHANYNTQFTGSGGQFLFDPLRVAIDPGQPTTPGIYWGRVQIVAVAQDDQHNISGPVSTSIDVQVIVLPSFRLAVGSDTMLDLDEITPGEVSKSLNFAAYANMGYQLTFVSGNDWRLGRPGDSKGQGLAYDGYVADDKLSTIDGSRRGTSFPHPGATAMRNHRFHVQVGPFDHQPAGDYSDDITVRIRAQL